MEKEELIIRIEELMEEVDDTLERLSEGDLTFSEVGDYYHSYHGDDILFILEVALQYIKRN